MKVYPLYKKWKSLRDVSKYPISYYNFWDGQTADQIWFTEYLRDRGFFEKYPHIHFSFFSTLGKVEILRMDEWMNLFRRNQKRIFFTGENVHYDAFKPYQHNLLDHKSIDISLGFDNISDDRYVRFPLWLLEMFPARASVELLKQRCDGYSYQKYDDRARFCAMVAGGGSNLLSSHLVMRKEMVEALSNIAKVDCAGRFLHNTDDLQVKFNDNKRQFLTQYKFYICPENISVENYVTEKVFHSITSGCIPIYYGALNNPEPEVLNHDAIIFWNHDGNNTAAVKKVEELWNDPKLYKEFFEQPRLQPHAWEAIADFFSEFDKKLNEICSRR